MTDDKLRNAITPAKFMYNKPRFLHESEYAYCVRMMSAYAAEVRAQTIAECAKVCRDAQKHTKMILDYETCRECAEAIERLAGNLAPKS